jgi:GAF domain-containing protein
METTWSEFRGVIDFIDRAGDSRGILKASLQEAMRLIGGDIVWAWLLDEDGRRLVLSDYVLSHATGVTVQYDRLEVLERSCSPAATAREGICWRAIRMRKAERIPDVRQDSAYIECCKETRSEVVAPLLFRGQPLGVLNVESTRNDAFTQEHEEILAVIAELAAAALKRRELQRNTDLIKEVGRDLASAQDLRQTLDKAVAAITQTTLARLCYLYLREGREESICLRAASKGFEDRIGKVSYKLGEGFTGGIFLAQEAGLRTRPVHGDGWIAKDLAVWNERTHDEPIVTLAGSPLIYGGSVIGVITLTNRDPKARSRFFSSNDLEVLRILSPVIAMAIHLARRLVRLQAVESSQEAGLSIVRQPEDWEQRLHQTPVDLQNLDMRIIYANPRQRKNLPVTIVEGESICYEVCNRLWNRLYPCPWCPVLGVFRGGVRVEAVTHSPTEPNGFVRHFNVIATPYQDGLTKERGALEAIMDITDTVELQDLLGRLAQAESPECVYADVCENVGRIFQALEMVVFTPEDVGWGPDERFHHVGRTHMAAVDEKIVERLERRCAEASEEDTLTAYLETRRDFPSSAYDGESFKRRKRPVDCEAGAWLATLRGGVQLVPPDALPSGVKDCFHSTTDSAFIALPVPLEEPRTVLVFRGDKDSLFFPNMSDDPQPAAVRAKARITCHAVSRLAELALKRVRRERNFRRSADLVKAWIRDIPKTSLEECFKNRVPELLGARSFSIFSLDPSDGLLHLVATTGLLHDDGSSYTKLEEAAVSYRVAPDDGLTGWVAYYNTPLSVPNGAFSIESLDTIFQNQVRPQNPGIDRPPRWAGKHNENRGAEHCYLGMPVTSSEGKVIGVCRVTGKSPQSGMQGFEKDDLELLTACCVILGLVMELRSKTEEYQWRLVSMRAGHHLKNALRPLLTKLDNLMDATPDMLPASKERLRLIIAELRLAADHVGRFYRFATGRRFRATEAVNPQDLVDQMMDRLRILAHGQQFTIRYPSRPVTEKIRINKGGAAGGL